MGFILTEAHEEAQPALQVSDDEIEETNEDNAFIDNTSIEQESISFYRDLNNLEHYPKFKNQTRNPIDAPYSDTESYFGEDTQPELYDPEEGDNVTFDLFKDFKKCAEKCKKTLLSFDDVENHLFYAVVYGLMYKKTDKVQLIKRENAQEVLGDRSFFELKEIEDSTMLDKSLFGYFSRCFAINQVLGKHGYFLRFFERRNQYQYLLRKKSQSKNQMLRELSTCTIRKFNGYEILKKNLEKKETKPHYSIDILVIILDKPLFCYFCPEIHVAYRSYIEKFRNGSKYVTNASVRQCHYSNNFFVKSEEKMKHHISFCAAKEGISYFFDNAKIIYYQDNYKYMGDVHFNIYFDFETTTGNAVFFDAKMFLVSNCMIVSFNKWLSFPK